MQIWKGGSIPFSLSPRGQRGPLPALWLHCCCYHFPLEGLPYTFTNSLRTVWEKIQDPLHPSERERGLLYRDYLCSGDGQCLILNTELAYRKRNLTRPQLQSFEVYSQVSMTVQLSAYLE